MALLCAVIGTPSSGKSCFIECVCRSGLEPRTSPNTGSVRIDDDHILVLMEKDIEANFDQFDSIVIFCDVSSAEDRLYGWEIYQKIMEKYPTIPVVLALNKHDKVEDDSVLLRQVAEWSDGKPVATSSILVHSRAGVLEKLAGVSAAHHSLSQY